MKTISVHLFRDSFDPFVGLLTDHGVKYQIREVRSGAPMAAGGTIEIVQAIGGAALWPSLAAVVVAYINSHRSRKVITTTKQGTVVHAEGHSPKELEAVLAQAQSFTAIDSNKEEGQSGS